ncbi:DNA mismatch repair protein MutT [Paenibacillus swuensis]|uniref:DNA mismatch repair protein MutT n=1 Tax=Paenibacillus swuensis TaxID=1178515 RepID=A0A172TGB5_9BACL|nr:NUDIX domain-containing protein [Paenibacillus swuensis]ANE45944.1 DNA mismatch repair protein MutT [Paenibacillus swuensis]
MEIQPAVAVMIRDEEGRLLLQKRADVGKWAVLSGHIEPGEKVEEAAVREVKEEAGLDVRIVRVIGVYSDPAAQVFHYPQGETVHFITIYLEGVAVGGTLKEADDESLEMRYFAPDDLPENMLPMQPQWLEDLLAEPGPAVLR